LVLLQSELNRCAFWSERTSVAVTWQHVSKLWQRGNEVVG